MKKVKYDGQRYWLFLDYSSIWVPFTNSSLEILIPILKTKYGNIEANVVYEIEDPKDRIYGMNHDPKCTAGYPNKDHYECNGKGILATFSHSWGWP